MEMGQSAPRAHVLGSVPHISQEASEEKSEDL